LDVEKDDANLSGRASQTKDTVFFGPFNLAVGERVLMKAGEPVKLGDRALDILIELASRPKEVVGKKDLIARVWPEVFVEEGSLRFHISTLRKALDEGKDSVRYIATVAGRGYSFVAPISRDTAVTGGNPADAVDFDAGSFLPARLARMVGREDGVRTLSAQLAASRFVTIVGPGGVGKTTLALAVAHDLQKGFAGTVLFVDLGMLNQPDMVVAGLTSMLGLSVQSDDPTPSLVAYLRDKKVLIILDNCEHVIDAAAALASCIHLAVPQAHILATSREALRVEGEQVYNLAPLGYPPAPGLTKTVILDYPAPKLFVERATASGAYLDLNDTDAATIADICRKLDGVPLAIELAAGRVQAYGLQQTAALLDKGLALLWQGKRSAPQRQKTLQATLEWSCRLLSQPERVVLRRLAVFVGQFTIEAALAVVPSRTIDESRVFGAIDSLVAKSMVATRPTGAMMRYRLLDTTRAYVLNLDVDDAELTDLAVRHAAYHRRWREGMRSEWQALSQTADRAPRLADLSNVRAALEWCLSHEDHAQVGVELAASAVPAFLALSLLTECHRWSERAIAALDGTTRGGCEEMHLQAALALSLMFTRGSSTAALAALEQSLTIAEDRGDDLNRLQVLGLLHMFHHRIGDFTRALSYAQRCLSLSTEISDPAASSLAHSLIGRTLRHVGDLSGARFALEQALLHGRQPQRKEVIDVGFDHYNFAGVALARTLWAQGFPAQAAERARETVTDAASRKQPVSLSIALAWAISVYLWTGDHDNARKHIDWFTSHAASHSLAPYIALGRGFSGELAIRQGDVERGVEWLEACLQTLHAIKYELMTVELNIALVQGLVKLRRFADANALTAETIRLVEASGDVSHMPELLRMKGSVLLSASDLNMKEAEACLQQSLEWSRRQTALSFELRAAMDLAEIWSCEGRTDAARTLLRPVYERFTEGHDTADLKAAADMLARLTP
jgi:predicted ATPase/DNA-binding winged helix-turn-helix (wHTH) protein